MIVLFSLNAFGLRVKHERERLEFSRKELAFKTGVPHYSVERIELGLTTSVAKAVVISYYLGIDIYEFVLDEEGLGMQQNLPLPPPPAGKS